MIFLLIKKLYKKIFCIHKNKTHIFTCYQDRYIKEQCDDCGKILYEEI